MPDIYHFVEHPAIHILMGPKVDVDCTKRQMSTQTANLPFLATNQGQASLSLLQPDEI